jgi:hypothetical protein
MKYPYRSEEQQAALDHIPHGPFVFSDKPYLFTERYSLSGFEPRDIVAKRLVDEQGIQDNIWFYERSKRG